MNSNALSQWGFALEQKGSGQLHCTVDGIKYFSVLPVRPFPLSAAEDGLSLLNEQGREVAWIARWQGLPDVWRDWLSEALKMREFLPEIIKIKSVSTFSTPSQWVITTDRGQTTLVLQAEEDIRRLPNRGLRITASYGVQYSIRDMNALGRASRRLLERFL